GRVTEVVQVTPLGETRGRHRLDGDDARIRLPRQLVRDEREGEAAEVRAAADASDEDVGAFARELELLLGLETDDGLVHEDMVEHGPERILRVLARRRIFDRLRDREAEAAWQIRVGSEGGAAGIRIRARARYHRGAPGL